MGPLITQSLAQLQASERLVSRPAIARKDGVADLRRRPGDAYESIASAIDPSQAVRSVASNEQEDAREDHQEHDRSKPPVPSEQARIDVQG